MFHRWHFKVPIIDAIFLSGFNTCQDTLTAVELRTVTCKVGAERGTVTKEVNISYLTLQEIQLYST